MKEHNENEIKGLFKNSKQTLLQQWQGSNTCWHKVEKTNERPPTLLILKILKLSNYNLKATALATFAILAIIILNFLIIDPQTSNSEIVISYEDYLDYYDLDPIYQEFDLLAQTSIEQSGEYDDLENETTIDLLEEIIQAI
ncbi:MAG: hypothetical protein A2504_10875 [Bdellovibrionales bacterium RIFOXYD12_FULL_39_22]|nr:MAG: hypothetical protein A2385_09440 [Bdellovibrionales bacterium RIFOXYB1_FULL_39_21]OFZ44182.1 MAG: hypothetical protein A2485_07060 [Bdellovibrionales bacterium RIFOXYC12_FULL_39_17]OFZ46724.1 MAG: hypothetical protein A2404_04295 [Bdellovibrionales bacterium RIFOXYC1_FULL_39_130]OFZ75999.1 MAG: hypothetical protein A2560_02855 [Bdellovibrionales bacterium RIFOXYD1_FULL_39_84]OFZ95404.1 MAG: hypothetical protein A2504_10875 [Bdellovibrionales bacterium RIFOXYD12_FULL_39_22]HLE09869.1 hy